MTLGKSLRLRRIFAQGRALIVDCDPCTDDPLGKVRLLARSGADAVVLTPGQLDLIADELGALAVILRIDGGMRARQLVSVQSALEMGAEAVAVSVAVGERVPAGTLDRFGRVTEEARRLGMPVFAEVQGDDWLAAARLGADYGADVIQARFVPEAGGCRNLVRMTGRPLVVSLDESHLRGADLLHAVYEVLQGPAQGVALGPLLINQPDPGPALHAVHALVHQGVSVDEAGGIAASAQAPPED